MSESFARNPHLAAAPLTSGPPPEEAAGAVILVHGRGAWPETMLDLAMRLALEDVHVLVPVAAGRTWYPQRFTAPVAANEPWLSHALEACDAAVQRLAGAGWAAERIVLAGFSQGGCLTLEYAARHPRRYGGVAALTGGLIGDDSELAHPQGLAGTPVLITTAEGDEWVPRGRTEQSARILAAGGADVDLRVFEPSPHGIRPQEVDAVRALIRAAGGP